jgi:hypothetical protein
MAIKLYLNDKNLKVIDIDCGDKPYFYLFKKVALEYLGYSRIYRGLYKKSEFVCERART